MKTTTMSATLGARTKSVVRFAAAMWVTTLAMGGTGLAAQEQVGCFRGQPLPQCKTFWIIEMQGLIPLAQTSRQVTYAGEFGYSYPSESFGDQVEWNLGHMVNVGGGYAVGGVLTVGSGSNNPLTGVRVRGRKWLSRDLSLELEGGLLRSDATGLRWEGQSGWTTDLRFNIRDQGSFFVRYDGLPLAAQSFSYPDNNGLSDPGGVQHGLLVGASAGSVPALVGSGLLGVYVAILVAALAGSN